MSAQHPEEWYVGDDLHYTIWTRGKKKWTRRFSRRTVYGVMAVLIGELLLTPRDKICVLDRSGQPYLDWE